MLDSDWLISKRFKKSSQKIFDSHWLILEFLKTPWLDWMIFSSMLNWMISNLIFFHVKNNWLRNLQFLFVLLFF